jgi:hypothetical protein
MERPLPESLRNAFNGDVLNYLNGKSAHSDIAEALTNAVKKLGDVQHFCPNPAQYRYLAVSTQGVIFGVATGMNFIAFQLDATFKDRALRTGADDAPDIGPNWASFAPFRNDWPQVDLEFWARKAYVFARETKT